jgi:hypothetical protein
MVDQLADLFRTTHKVKTQQVVKSRGQKRHEKKPEKKIMLKEGEKKPPFGSQIEDTQDYSRDKSLESESES